MSLLLKMISLGLGKQITTVPPENLLKILKLLFGLYFVFDLSITIPKCSVLLFYIRIFGTSSKCFRYSVYGIQALNLAWLLSIWVFTIFQCHPVQKAWMPSVPGHCVSTSSLWLASAIPSVAIDLMILFVPLPMLWQLQMKKSRKALIIGVFSCGYR